MPNESYRSSFTSGLDPTGYLTFERALINEDKQNRYKHRLVGTLAGILSGVTVVPAIAGGLIGGIQGLRHGKAGLLKGIYTGAKAPFTNANDIYALGISGALSGGGVYLNAGQGFSAGDRIRKAEDRG